MKVEVSAIIPKCNTTPAIAITPCGEIYTYRDFGNCLFRSQSGWERFRLSHPDDCMALFNSVASRSGFVHRGIMYIEVKS